MDRSFSAEARREQRDEAEVLALARAAEALEKTYTPPNNIWRALSNAHVPEERRTEWFGKIMAILKRKDASRAKEEARPDRVPFRERADMLREAELRELGMPREDD